MRLLRKKDQPFNDERLNILWNKWNNKNQNSDWKSVQTLIKVNLLESLITFAETPGIISSREANKDREKGEKLSTEFAKISFYLGLEFASRDDGLALRVPAGGEIPKEALDLLKIVIEPVYEFCRSLVLITHNQRSSAVERDKFILDTKRVLTEQAFKCFEIGLAASLK